MIQSGLGYLLSVASIAAFFGITERLKMSRFLFDWLPAVVLIYLSAMVAAQAGLWAHTPVIDAIYRTAKGNLLPAMLFLMLLSVDLKRFFKLGPKLLTAYASATLSIFVAFVIVFRLFGLICQPFLVQRHQIQAATCNLLRHHFISASNGGR